MTDDKPKTNSLSHEKMQHIAHSLPSPKELEDLSEFFKIFGDISRLRIIHVLSVQELCVADLAALLNMQQPAVSQQLKLLRLARLAKYRKVGKTVFYSLDDEHVGQIFRIARSHLLENKG